MATGRTLSGLSRRELLMAIAGAATATSVFGQKTLPGALASSQAALKTDDRLFLEDYLKRCVRYFWEQADPHTGIVMDRARSDGAHSGGNVGSTAATGFGLSALCIGASRGWLPRDQVRSRVLVTLRYFWGHAFHDHGWYYHFIDASNGGRRLNSEISSIDTALLLCGILTAGGYFAGDREIQSLVHQIFDRVDFTWMLNGNPLLLSHGVMPGSGFLKASWNAYSEASVLYLMAIGSSRHPISAESWYAWVRPEVRYDDWVFVSGGPLFTHQYSHAWVDFRHQKDGDPSYVDYFQNSIVATYAHRDFCISLQTRYAGYGPNMWGITASDSPVGYVAWGGPPFAGPINGTIVPCAAAGSLMFAHDICLPVLREMKNVYGDRVYGRYGFVDAFNPNWGDQKLWVNQDVVGIDVGISALSIENALSGNVWRWFMRNQYVQTGMEKAGFRLSTPGTVLKQKRVLKQA